MEGSTNRMQRIGQRETNSRVLGIKLECHALLGRRADSDRQKCDHRQRWQSPGGLLAANSVGGLFHRLSSQESPSQGDSVERHVKRRSASHMQSQQSAKNLRMPPKNPERPLLKPGTAV